MLSLVLPSLNSLTDRITLSVLKFWSLMVHSMSCIQDLKTNRAPDDVPPSELLDFWLSATFKLGWQSLHRVL